MAGQSRRDLDGDESAASDVYVAIESFTWRDPWDGASVPFTSGVTRVSREHPVLKDPAVRSRFVPVSAASDRAARMGGKYAPGRRKVAVEPRREDGAPDWWLGPYVPFVAREQVERTAKHEAAHAVAAHMLGWHVERVVVRADKSGKTVFYWPEDCPPERRVAERAVIAASAEAYVGWASGRDYEGDRRTVREAVQRCPDPRSRDLYRVELKAYAQRLVKRPRFRQLALQVTDAVIEAGGVLECEQLRAALGW